MNFGTYVPGQTPSIFVHAGPAPVATLGLEQISGRAALAHLNTIRKFEKCGAGYTYVIWDRVLQTCQLECQLEWRSWRWAARHYPKSTGEGKAVPVS